MNMECRYRSLRNDRNINEDQSDTRSLKMSTASTRRFVLVMCFGISVLCILFGFVIGWFSHQPAKRSINTDAVDPEISNKLLSSIDKENIRHHLREMTRFTHMAGTEEEERLEEMIVDIWRAQGLRVVVGQAYDVLLSYPNPTDPSWAEILDSTSGETIHRTSVRERNVTPEHWTSPASPTFHAYAVPGDVMGDLIYANTAAEEDFLKLRDEFGINITGKIVIARYGSSYRGDKVKFAAQFGAAAILLYMDPQDFTEPGHSVYPYSEWLPGFAVQRGTILTGNGDPLTPHYPSTGTAYRVTDRKETWLPKIPSHPISYDDAYQFLSRMSGAVAPDDWQGGFNFTYHLGPGFTQSLWKSRVRITQHDERKSVRNVFGVINGTVEPDRYVLLGNHRDAWTYGGIDPTSATAAMLELSRAFMQLHHNGWRPRRTIIFCSWAAEEYGLIGSVEFVEDYVKLLTTRAVAYLNVDYIMDGSDSITVGSMPTLRNLIYNSAKKITSPHDAKRMVYDDWLEIFPSSDFANTPSLDSLGDSSDHGGFVFAAGVPCYDAWYTTQRNDGYPLYHTAYDGFDLYNNYTDPDFKVTLSMTQFWGETVLHLADSAILPFNVTHYSIVLKLFVSKFGAGYGEQIRKHNISLDGLYDAADLFQQAAVRFHEQLNLHQHSLSAYDIRSYNDQMMSVDRAFIDPAGLPLNPAYRHVVYAPSQYNSYAGTSFPGLTDLLHEINAVKSAGDDTKLLWENFRQHLATIIFCFRSATANLKTPTDFIYA